MLKFNKGIGVLLFVRPHLDDGDIIYDKPKNESFCQKLKSYQYNAGLIITGAIRGIYIHLKLKLMMIWALNP